MPITTLSLIVRTYSTNIDWAEIMLAQEKQIIRKGRFFLKTHVFFIFGLNEL
jgi:hypothetical protein